MSRNKTKEIPKSELNQLQIRTKQNKNNNWDQHKQQKNG